MRFPSQTMKGLTPVLVLEALGKENLSGVEIIDHIRERTHGGIEVPEGTIYPLLHRLEAQGLVQSQWTLSEGKRRRGYVATALGCQAGAAEREAWQDLITALQAMWGSAKGRA